MNKNNLIQMMLEIEKISKRYNLEYQLAYGSLLGAVRERGIIPWDEEIDIWVKQDVYDIFIKLLTKDISDNFEVVNQKKKDYELYFSRVCLTNENHHSLHIDIFPLIGTPNEKNEIRKFVDVSYLFNKMYYLKKINAKKMYKNNNRMTRYYQAILSKFLLAFLPIKLVEKKLNTILNNHKITESKFLYTFGGSYKMREVFKKEYFSNIQYVQFEDIELPISTRYDEILKQIYGDYMIPRKDNYLSKG